MPFVTQILLPRRDNSGLAFSRERFDPFHRRLIRRFGGWTRKGHAEGAWLSPSGKLYIDEHWVYDVSHSGRDVRFWLAEKERLKAEFDQEEIWMMQYEGRLI